MLYYCKCVYYSNKILSILPHPCVLPDCHHRSGNTVTHYYRDKDGKTYKTPLVKQETNTQAPRCPRKGEGCRELPHCQTQLCVREREREIGRERERAHLPPTHSPPVTHSEDEGH